MNHKENYKKDAKGNMIAIENIRDVDLARDDLVHELVQSALDTQAAIKSFKEKAFGDIAAFVELSAEQYGVQIGGKKGNVTLHSFDGQFKIQRAISEHITFDERIHAAQALIQECLDEWSEGANANLKTLVQRAFEVDADGNLSTNRILGLRRVKIADERWHQAMAAIGESLQVIGSKAYVRLYQRVGDSERYEPIPLDVAGV